ncbi:hypothetical protein SAY87_008587 [Trapa incisa]|uniref:Integrator complex subunit 7-like C-terminal domain-containing protein n=1 Tax=Trapa incisa TaxID=236973 RepID=A0AAN7JTW1_9MYRT|nr:hypothetical protein SAY87_008587 [Trapa incisa]
MNNFLPYFFSTDSDNCKLIQILLAMLPDISQMDMMEFDKLLSCIISASHCPVQSKSLLALHCLADSCIRLGDVLKVGRNGMSSSIPSDVASLLVDRIILLVRPLKDGSQIDFKIFVELRTELSCLLQLIRNHTSLSLPVLDKFNLLLEHLITDQLALPQEDLTDERHTSISTKIMIMLYKFLVAFLDFVYEIDVITPQVFDKIKIFIQGIRNCKSSTLYVQTVYSMMLHSRRTWSGLLKDGVISEKFFCGYWVESEGFTLMCTQKMLLEEDYWLLYESGKCAASHGSWFIATFIFGNLMTKVKSHSCCGWLNSLAQLSLCEMKIQLLVLPNQESRTQYLEFIKLFHIALFEDGITEDGKQVGDHTDAADYAEKLAHAYGYLNSACELLKFCTTSGKTFCFQKWFLALRVKMLGIVLEIVNVLVQKGIHICMALCLQKLTVLSARLKRLSEEFDLLAMTFIHIDRRSLKILSGLALGCALLSFAAGFALFIPNLQFCQILASSQENISADMLVHNLSVRLVPMDDNVSVNLSSLLNAGGCPKSCHHSHSRSRALSSGAEVKEFLTLCHISVSRVLHLQNQVKQSREQEHVSTVTENGRDLLLDVTMGLMRIPFQTPEYYFRTRPCIGSELFVVNRDTKNSNGISISQGFCLSLDICIQLKNVPASLPARSLKLHCIIYCNLSFQEPVEPSDNSARDASWPWETDDMLMLNEELYQYITRRAKKNDLWHVRDSSDGKAARAFVSFQANDRGQGFSNCLLDVSHFPSGTYRMRWHSCCIDGQGAYWSFLPLNAGPIFTIH